MLALASAASKGVDIGSPFLRVSEYIGTRESWKQRLGLLCKAATIGYRAVEVFAIVALLYIYFLARFLISAFRRTISSSLCAWYSESQSP
jgi:hypothetical protein